MFTQAEVQLFKSEVQGLIERWAPYLLGSTINDPDSFAVRIDMDRAKTGEGTLLSKGNQASDKGDKLDVVSIVWTTGVSKKKSGLYGSKRYYIKSGEFCHFDLGLDPWKAKMHLIWVTHHG